MDYIRCHRRECQSRNIKLTERANASDATNRNRESPHRSIRMNGRRVVWWLSYQPWTFGSLHLFGMSKNNDFYLVLKQYLKCENGMPTACLLLFDVTKQIKWILDGTPIFINKFWNDVKQSFSQSFDSYEILLKNLSNPNSKFPVIYV